MDEEPDRPAWPVLELDASDAPAQDAVTVIADGLRAALEAATPFAAVLRVPPPAGRQRRTAGAVERVRILRQLRPGLAERCRGLAFVMPAEALHADTRLARSGPKLWGCPTTATDDIEQARAWAREQLTDAERER